MSASSNNTARMSRDQLIVDDADRPGWLRASERTPAVGEEVHCTEGLARVARIHGKTSDGSRLLELTLSDRPRHPFFAAASNVLVPPVATTG